MEPAKRIPLEEADAATLRHYAETILGLEVKSGTNGPSLRAAILRARPDLTDVPAIPEPPAPVVEAQLEGPIGFDPETENPAARPAAVSRPASPQLRSHQADPKVELMISQTADKQRSKDVTISVNGDVFRIQRGQKVSVPYRVYLALMNAVEKVPVDTGEVNRETQTTVYAWSEVPSYPFMVYKTPSQDEIDAWHDATSSGFQQAA